MDTTALPIDIPSVVLERVRAIWQYYHLSMGVRGIDGQHVWLIVLVMDLEWRLAHELTEKEDGDSNLSLELQDIIAELTEYANRHFRAEELLLKEFSFAETAEHIKTHDNFTDGLSRILRNGKLIHRQDAEKLQRFLRQWLLHHIHREDRKYSDFFHRRKLVDKANEFFDNLKDPAARVDPAKLEILRIVNRRRDTIDCTTPTVIEEISSIWNRLNLRIGIPLIDIQHLWLIKMIVDMDEAMSDSASTQIAVFSQTISEVLEYIDVHFRTEEELMKVIGFEDLENHQKKHEHFEKFVEKRIWDFEMGNKRAAMTLVSDLRQWLTSHIAIEDRQLTGFYRENREAALAFSRERIHSGQAGLRQNQLNLYKTITERESNRETPDAG